MMIADQQDVGSWCRVRSAGRRRGDIERRGVTLGSAFSVLRGFGLRLCKAPCRWSRCIIGPVVERRSPSAERFQWCCTRQVSTAVGNRCSSPYHSGRAQSRKRHGRSWLCRESTESPVLSTRLSMPSFEADEVAAAALMALLECQNLAVPFGELDCVRPAEVMFETRRWLMNCEMSMRRPRLSIKFGQVALESAG